jgi:hypothetical protein
MTLKEGAGVYVLFLKKYSDYQVPENLYLGQLLFVTKLYPVNAI